MLIIRTCRTCPASPRLYASLSSGCEPCEMPEKIAVATMATFATTPYAATPMLPESPRIRKFSTIVVMPPAISPMNPETPTALTCASSLNVGLCQRKRSVFVFLRKCRALIPMPTMGDAAVASAAPAMPIPSGNISTQSITILNRLDAIVAVMASDGSPSLRTKERRM